MICDQCGFDASCFSVRLTARGPRRVCRVCRSPRARQSVVNPYDLTLDHVHGHDGQPVRVSSLRQLQAAEREFGFKSLVANEREADFDKPPQTRQKDLFEATSEAGGWLYPELAEAMIPELREAGEI